MSLTAKHIRKITEYLRVHGEMPDYHAVGDAGEWLDLADEVRKTSSWDTTFVDPKVPLVHFLLCGVPVIPYDPADLP